MIRNKPGQINLAFLDTLSCSLGGMMVLFFIFASMTHDGARELREPEIDSDSVIATLSTSQGARSPSNLPTLYLLTGSSGCVPINDPNSDKYKVKSADGDFLLYVYHSNQAGNQPFQIELDQCIPSQKSILIEPIMPAGATEGPYDVPAGNPKLNYENRQWSVGG